MAHQLIAKHWVVVVDKSLEQARLCGDKTVAAQWLVSALELIAIHDPHQAQMEALLRQALTLDPKNLRAVELLATFVLDGNVDEQKWDNLEVYFRSSRQFAPTSEAMLAFYRKYYRVKNEPNKLLVLLDQARQSPVIDDQHQTAVIYEMATIAQHEAQQVEKAIELWRLLLASPPHASQATDALRILYRQADPPKWNALRELILERLAVIDGANRSEQLSLLDELAVLYRDHLKVPILLLDVYKEILSLKMPEAGAGADADNRDEIKDLLTQIAQLAETQLGDYAESIWAWNMVLSVGKNDNDPTALAALAHLYEKSHRHAALQEVKRRHLL